jgi:outer membrane protein OmpA-like peptidoglycan-associated protein
MESTGQSEQATTQRNALAEHLASRGVDVLFGEDQSFLNFTAKKNIDIFMGNNESIKKNLLIPNSPYKIGWKGYASMTGSERYNWTLSEKRCHAVMRYFIEKFRIPHDRFTDIEFFGKSQAITSFNADTDKRVEIKIGIL